MPPIPLDQVTFDFFARYVLTGFLIFLIRNAYVVGERPKIAEIALDVALFSLINQMVWQVLVWLLGLLHGVAIKVSTAPQHVAGWIPDERLAFVAEVLLMPIVIGVLSGRALRNGWTAGVYRVLSIPLTDPLPRAYDHVFSTRGIGFVIVTYKDGTQVFGYYGEKSRAGRDPSRSELYIERLYVPQGNGPWVEMQPPRAVLLYLSEVRSIEFID